MQEWEQYGYGDMGSYLDAVNASAASGTPLQYGGIKKTTPAAGIPPIDIASPPPTNTQYPAINGANWNPNSGVPYDTWATNFRAASGGTPQTGGVTYSSPPPSTSTGTPGSVTGTTGVNIYNPGTTITTPSSATDDSKYKGYQPTPFDPYSFYGLDVASGLLAGNLAGGSSSSYPSYVSPTTYAPGKENYFEYVPTASMQQVTTPDYSMTAGEYDQTAGEYKGLMGGDYEALQKALMTPGQLEAQGAYGQGYNNLKSTMGGRGLYGSSMMQNQATQGLDKVLQETLAKNAASAAAQRYGLQSDELGRLNTFNANREQNLNQYNLSREQELNKYNAQIADLQRQQNYDTWLSKATEADRKMQYGEGNMNWNQDYANSMRDWQNNGLYNKFLYDIEANQYGNAQKESLLNQALAIAGQGAPLTSAASAAQTAAANRAQQAQIAQQANDVASTNGWLGLAGTLGGGLLNYYGKGNTTK